MFLSVFQLFSAKVTLNFDISHISVCFSTVFKRIDGAPPVILSICSTVVHSRHIIVDLTAEAVHVIRISLPDR